MARLTIILGLHHLSLYFQNYFRKCLTSWQPRSSRVFLFWLTNWPA